MHVKATMKGICIQLISLLVSWTAIIFSTIALVGKAPATAEGGALTIMSICVTLIVGVSVVDAIAVRETLSRYDAKIDAMTKKMDELSSLNKQFHKTKRQTNLLLHYTWGLSFSKEQPYTAIAEYWKAIELAASDNDVKRAKSCIHNLEEVVKRVLEEPKQMADNSNKEDLNNIPKEVSKEMRESSVYSAFAERLDKLITQIGQIKST